MRWLIVLDGSARSERAAVYSAALVAPGEDEVVFLAAGEGVTPPPAVQEAFHGIQVREKPVPPDLPEGVPPAAVEEAADIVVYGSRGRRGLSSLLLGSVAAYLERRLACSLLVARGTLPPIRQILVASSLHPEGQRPVEMAARLAKRTGASVTLLHVMSQLPLSDDAPETPLVASAEEAIALETREGLLLDERLEHLHLAGVPARPVLRHGLVLDELETEMRSGKYDLLVIGRHRNPADLPFASLLTEDVAGDILMTTTASLLIV